MYPHEYWMQMMREELEDMRLSRVALPGSHDAGTVGISPSSPWCTARQYWWTPLAQIAPCITAKYAKTQNLSLHEQARLGVRYFDLRVCAEGGKFRFTHGLLGGDFLEGIRTLCTFAKDHPFEVLVLDIRKFRCFSPDTHQLLQREILKEAEPFLARIPDVTPASTLRELWRLDKNIIVAYHSRHALPMFWTGQHIYTRWANKRDPMECLDWLDQELQRRTPDEERMYVLQACLTPDTSYVVRHVWSNVQALARTLNVPLVKRIPRWGPSLNAIMVDTVEEPGYVDAVIAANKNVQGK